MKNLTLAALSLAAMLLVPTVVSAHPDRNWNRNPTYNNSNYNNSNRNWNRNQIIIRDDWDRRLNRFSYENYNRNYNNYRINEYRNNFARKNYYQELERRRLNEYQNRRIYLQNSPSIDIDLRFGF